MPCFQAGEAKHSEELPAVANRVERLTSLTGTVASRLS